MQQDGRRKVGRRRARCGGSPSSPDPTAARSSRSSSWRRSRPCSGVASPVLAGRAVDAIVDGDDAGRVIGIAVADRRRWRCVDAGVGLLERLQSSRLGEDLILDLRRRVFEHVQRMPIAFFTRTHTGALVSRLNNDVIGAQRAFTSALSGVVTNVIALVLTLAVMLSLSWQITVARAGAPAGVRHPGPARRRQGRRARAGGGRAQRGDDVADDRALLGARRHAGQAVRPPARGGGRVRPPRRAGPRHRRALGDGDGGVLPRPRRSCRASRRR